MNFVQFCVRRKVTVLMFIVLIFICGIISWFRLDREFMPDLQFPQLTVLTNYPNASSQEIENFITKVIEESAGTVRNVHRIHSISREGISIVTVEFIWGTNMDLASLNLREKVDLAKAKLPRDAGEPRIEKFNPFALPVLTLSLSGNLSEKDLLALAKRPTAEILERTRGVAAVSIVGGREREILVEADQNKLTARGLAISDVGQSIARSNLTYPAGSVKDEKIEYVVRVMGTFDAVPDLKEIAVNVDREKISSGMNAEQARRKKQQISKSKTVPQAVTLESVAQVTDTLAEISSYSRYNGKSNISISILKQAESNIVRVADDVLEKLPDIQAKLPKDVKLEVVYNQSTFVKNGISSMVQDCLFGGFLAVLLLILFLGSWRDALVVSCAIPISIALGFFLMYLKGLTINTVTLAGLAIGIGMLVDGAIVVQENIARHKAMGKPLDEAAIEGTQEVLSAVMGSVLTTVVVFLPFIFVGGIVGQVFRALSWSVVFSQSASLLAAFVIPTLSSQISTTKEEKNPLLHFKIGEKCLTWLHKKADRWESWYARALDYCLKYPSKMVGITTVAFIVSVIGLSFLPKTLFPSVNSDQIIMQLNMPVGTALEYTNAMTVKIERVLENFPEIQNRSVTVGSLPQEGVQPLGSHQAKMVLDLNQNRKKNSGQIVQQLKERFKQENLGGGQVFFFDQGGAFSFLGAQEAPVSIEVKGHDLDQLEKISNQLAARLKTVKGLYNVRTSISEPAPELQLQVQRESMANLGLSVTELADSALTAIRGKVVSKFHDQGKEIDIRLRLRPQDRSNPESVQNLWIHTPIGEDAHLGSVATIRRGVGPSEILRYDQQRTVLVNADLSGRSIDKVAKEVETILTPYRSTKDVSLFLTGESAKLAESSKDIQLILLLSIVLVFMIMASEFESLWQPFLILGTIPFSLIGMTIGLTISFTPMSAMAGMGLVLLAGIVVDNGIVLIEFVNEERREGMALKEALVRGCRIRLRPILMTATSTVLGMLPLACGIGQGADTQSPMAKVVISGLLVSTFLTLLILPALFLLVDEKILKPGVYTLLKKFLRFKG